MNNLITLDAQLRNLHPLPRAVLLAEELARRYKENKLQYYRPYKKQRVFHTAGARFRQRLFMAGNQLGKTLSGGAETAMHLTGLYPDWWEGRRFLEPIRAWAASKSGEVTRDSVQRILVGPPEAEALFGTGMVPKHLLLDYARGRGVPNLLSSISVRHITGGVSHLGFKSYDQGREKFQAETLHLVWEDEEPPAEIHSESVTRTNATSGIVYLTFTPLLGMSEVVRQFLHTDTDAVRDKEIAEGERHVTKMTIFDVEHYTDEERKRIIARYPAHERDARARGIPMLGSGRVFPIDESQIICDPFAVPNSWRVIGGIDFGYDHPTAAVRLAYDDSTDTIYVTAEHRVKEQIPEVHYATLRAWGKTLTWAWPHDGYQRDKGSGVGLRNAYRSLGLRMTAQHAQYGDGTSGLEASVMEMLSRMQTGRFKVFSNCQMFVDEFRLYHRKNGQIIKEYDDLISACRYAMMMLRYARALVDVERAEIADADYSEM